MRYAEYKDTGNRFIPSIPLNWSIKSGRYCFEENAVKNSDLSQRNLLQFTYGTIVRKKNQEIPADSEEIYRKYTQVIPNDIMLNGLNLNYDFVSQRVGIVRESGIITSAYLSLRCHSVYNPFYANYVLKSFDAQKIFHGMGSGVRLTLGYTEFSTISFPVPPKDEQEQIVRYLDWQISNINKLIHGYQQEIKLLEERRLTVINDAVVHGIDATVEKNCTKAEWMGQVPTRWHQMRMKNLFKEINDRSPDGKEPHLSMSQKKGLVTDDDSIGRPLLSESYAGAKICDTDDLVLNRLKAHLGVFALAPIRGIVSPDYTVLRLNRSRIVPKYAEYLLKSQDCRKELKTRVRGIVEGFWRLYTDDLGAIPVCVPDLEEQEWILNYIADHIKPIEHGIRFIEKEIELLGEYRTRLISDVVTGQMDVRGIEIPDYTPVEDVDSENESEEEEVMESAD
jgi:type I restriction enzyme S subunit